MSKNYKYALYYSLSAVIVLSMTACGGGGKKGGGGTVYVPPARRTLTDQPFAVYSHKSTKLQNGDILVTGGFINGAPSDDAYAYDSSVSNRFYDVDLVSIRND